MRAILACLILAGCASPYAGTTDPTIAACDYETNIAIQHIDNPLYAGIRKGELMNQCVTARRLSQAQTR